MAKKITHALACALGLGLWFEKENLEKKPPLYIPNLKSQKLKVGTFSTAQWEHWEV
jgi:hypothetical protein